MGLLMDLQNVTQYELISHVMLEYELMVNGFALTMQRNKAPHNLVLNVYKSLQLGLLPQ